MQAALPVRYHSARLTDFPEAVVARVMEWLKRPSDGLLLCGPAGTGKTHLAAALTRACIEVRRPVLFRRAADLFLAIRQSYEHSDFSEDTVLGEYAGAPLLVLDDIGAGALSDFERRATLEILDRRLNALRPTVVTTNWDTDDIRERMDERIASRLAGFTLLMFAGDDRRDGRAHAGG